MQESQSPAPDWESLGVAGALLSRYEQDQQALIEQLATFLESTLPRQTSVHRTLGVVGPRRTAGMAVPRWLNLRTLAARSPASRQA